ncbi:polysaccharide biosynthesis protein [Fulvivirgaceae bacterium BMA10]|uniref:Polysaccharide biosynthesis protein n=1 Tax=Splendidivirga corallicola TaxID=3051826 RepID=A0ABT8KX71_9BACT|nr:polysaccharide biosynthesis protein [Fulvivirgaceae bacterium BMA10]
MVRQVVRYKPETLILLDQGETPLYEIEREIKDLQTAIEVYAVICDVRNKKRLEWVFNNFAPEIVFHAAAYKHVPMMENNPSEAVQCNILGTKNLADTAVKCGVKRFVMISTDKAVNPTNVMGASKRIAEIYVQSLSTSLKRDDQPSTSFITTRFGNVLGSNGSVIPLFKKQIAEGGPVTVTHPEMTRYFMTIPEACQLSLEAGVMGKGNEIFIIDMGKSIKIVNLAKKMIKLSGFELGRDIEITYTGLRDGEKLYEELLNNKENTIQTHHPKIMIAKVRKEDFKEVKPKVEELIKMSESDDDLKMVMMMKKIVPEFISNSSKFEELDKKMINL